jgi:hypothetical protein
MAPDTKLLAKEWIAYWKEKGRTDVLPDSDIGTVIDELSHSNPVACWEIVLEILAAIEHKPENPLFQILASGILEDLLGDQPALIERVEVEARANPAFNFLLGGVWEGSMPPEVWARVQKCRLNVW